MNAGAGHVAALEAAFADHAHLIHRVLIECKRPPDTWRQVQRLRVKVDPDSPIAPDEWVAACMKYMREEQDERGEAKFRVQGWGHDDKGAEVRHVNLETGIDPPSTADQRASSETNAMVATNEMLRRLAEDEHRQKMELFKIAIEIPKTTVEVLKAMPEAMGKSDKHYEVMIKALGYHYMDRDEERQARERVEDNKMRFETLEKALAKLEPIGMAWLFKIMAENGLDPSTIDPSFAGGGARPGAGGAAANGGVTVTQVVSAKATTIKTFCKSLTNDEKTKIILAFDGDRDGDMGGDALAVLFGAAEAPTDQACEACLRKLRELLKDHDAMWMAMTLRGIVGDRVVPLVPILKPIWEAT